MAGGLMANGRRQGRQRLRRFNLQAEINITPFVDVMLVLLIIFMVSAPLMTQGVQVALPQTQAAPITSTDDPIQVSIKRDGSFFLEQRRVSATELGARLQALQQLRPNAQILLRADKDVPYGRVMQVMSSLQSAGLVDVGLVTEPTPATGL